MYFDVIPGIGVRARWRRGYRLGRWGLLPKDRGGKVRLPGCSFRLWGVGVIGEVQRTGRIDAGFEVGGGRTTLAGGLEG